MANAKKASSKGKRTKNQRAANGQVLIVDEGARNDIAGVALIVLAVALAFALFSQSQAIITSTVHTGLIRGFGAGAMLVPVALLLFGATFFVTTDTPLSARVAIGLGLVVVAVLSLLSVNAPGAAENPESVLLDPILSTAGGYVGGGVAWVLLRLVGVGVGDVLLAGVIIAGIIVCGFSVSDLVAKVRGQAVRITFHGAAAADKPLIASMAMERSIAASILNASTRTVGDKVYGYMLLDIPGGPDVLAEAVKYLSAEPDVSVQVEANYGVNSGEEVSE